MIIIIDNYDSFTYNLYQYVRELVAPMSDVRVYRHDEITIPQLEALQPDRIIISPGPGSPHDAGISNDVIRYAADTIPLLGVCLGHQCLAQVYGARILRANEPKHGKVSAIKHDGRGVFAGIPNPLRVTRYHSLIVDPMSLNQKIEISAQTDAGEIMGLRIQGTRAESVQFHPESVMTEHGKKMINNFLKM